MMACLCICAAISSSTSTASSERNFAHCNKQKLLCVRKLSWQEKAASSVSHIEHIPPLFMWLTLQTREKTLVSPNNSLMLTAVFYIDSDKIKWRCTPKEMT
uniref:Secreted protein n=1 Tax=Ascaris lumbricoides TaxID=6252 RepID=A0A0M3HNK2_ASCLU